MYEEITQSKYRKLVEKLDKTQLKKLTPVVLMKIVEQHKLGSKIVKTNDLDKLHEINVIAHELYNIYQEILGCRFSTDPFDGLKLSEFEYNRYWKMRFYMVDFENWALRIPMAHVKAGFDFLEEYDNSDTKQIRDELFEEMKIIIQ